MESRNQRGHLEHRHLERDPRPSPGNRVPLFDRLTAPLNIAQENAGPYQSLSVREAIESVRADLSRLLNSRTVLKGPQLTTLNFGLPDFSHVSAMDMQARNDLGTRITRIIEDFEPRLSQVRVSIEAHRSGERYLAGNVTGVLRMGTVPEPVAFELALPAAIMRPAPIPDEMNIPSRGDLTSS